jgi:hypothetical protein
MEVNEFDIAECERLLAYLRKGKRPPVGPTFQIAGVAFVATPKGLKWD